MKPDTESKKIKSAVSLRYDLESAKAPKVTAKGRGEVAERIIALARKHDIPVKEDPDLVEILSYLDIGEEIPPSVYQVVAELLAFIYSVNKNYPERAGYESSGARKTPINQGNTPFLKRTGMVPDF